MALIRSEAVPRLLLLVVVFELSSSSWLGGVCWFHRPASSGGLSVLLWLAMVVLAAASPGDVQSSAIGCGGDLQAGAAEAVSNTVPNKTSLLPRWL